MDNRTVECLGQDRQLRENSVRFSAVDPRKISASRTQTSARTRRRNHPTAGKHRPRRKMRKGECRPHLEVRPLDPLEIHLHITVRSSSTTCADDQVVDEEEGTEAPQPQLLLQLLLLPLLPPLPPPPHHFRCREPGSEIRPPPRSRPRFHLPSRLFT